MGLYCTTCNQTACSKCSIYVHNSNNSNISHKMEYIDDHYTTKEAEIKSMKLPFETFEAVYRKRVSADN